MILTVNSWHQVAFSKQLDGNLSQKKIVFIDMYVSLDLDAFEIEVCVGVKL